jgi:bifunctional DNA-binding transcriptional regulator/antitoxin component of YhaV-PrlF toxin-antitoxin module
MTLTRRLVENVAFCTGRLSSNNFFSVSANDVRAANLEAGEEMRVILIRTDINGNIQPRDRAVYSASFQKSNQLYVPKDVRDKLDLEDGDLIKYFVIPQSAFPGIRDGPLREYLKDNVGASPEVEETQEQDERPERETSRAEFSGSMQKTGQVTVPASVMDKMGLVQGDQVLATIEWLDDDISSNKQIGTGNRITITKDERSELGLEPGDTPSISIAFFG